MNNIQLIGRLTATPELKQTNSGLHYCKFCIAVERVSKDKKTDFINCSAFDKKAEVIAEYCNKGDQIGISGSLEINKTDKGTFHNVNVWTVDLLSNKSSGKSKPVDDEINNDDDYGDFGEELAPKKAKQPQKETVDDDDEYPF